MKSVLEAINLKPSFISVKTFLCFCVFSNDSFIELLIDHLDPLDTNFVILHTYSRSKKPSYLDTECGQNELDNAYVLAFSDAANL